MGPAVANLDDLAVAGLEVPDARAIAAALAEFPPVTASVGVAWFDRACPRFDAMVAAADDLMYEAKQRQG